MALAIIIYFSDKKLKMMAIAKDYYTGFPPSRE